MTLSSISLHDLAMEVTELHAWFTSSNKPKKTTELYSTAKLSHEERKLNTHQFHFPFSNKPQKHRKPQITVSFAKLRYKERKLDPLQFFFHSQDKPQKHGKPQNYSFNCKA